MQTLKDFDNFYRVFSLEKWDPNAPSEITRFKNTLNFIKQSIDPNYIYLDIGTSSGYLSNQIKVQNNLKNYYSVDFSMSMLIDNPTNRVCADLRNLPFKKADVIYLFEVLYYLPVSQQISVLNHITKFLNPKFIYISGPFNQYNKFTNTSYLNTQTIFSFVNQHSNYDLRPMFELNEISRWNILELSRKSNTILAN